MLIKQLTVKCRRPNVHWKRQLTVRHINTFSHSVSSIWYPAAMTQIRTRCVTLSSQSEDAAGATCPKTPRRLPARHEFDKIPASSKRFATMMPDVWRRQLPAQRPRQRRWDGHIPSSSNRPSQAVCHPILQRATSSPPRQSPKPPLTVICTHHRSRP
jgi:hypothetical protein